MVDAVLYHVCRADMGQEHNGALSAYVQVCPAAYVGVCAHICVCSYLCVLAALYVHLQDEVLCLCTSEYVCTKIA